jgi:nicotinate-nucleotide pyrophosphorylase (carboxylating)
MSAELNHPDPETVRLAVAAALAEDRAGYDVTTRSTVPAEQQGRGAFVFREPGVVCGIEVARETFAQLSPGLQLEAAYEDGTPVEAGTTVATISGPLAAMLSAERVALNFMQRLSGIASVTRQYVKEAARGGDARVVDTRKTTPGLRLFERYAVRCGGAHNHRDNLQDGVLIKDNHLAAAADRGVSISAVIDGAREAAAHTLRIEVEVDTPEQATEAIEAGADIVLLDNMDPETMRPIVERQPEGVLFEASGGVNLDTIRAIAATGVQLISVGALTHSAPSLDIGLDIAPGSTGVRA